LKNRKGGEKGKNMKNNKFCVSRTLVYLVLLVVAVFGAFYVMNYANSQKLGGKPRAAGGNPPTCPYYITGSTKRFVAEKVDNVCYGFTGRYTKYWQEPTKYSLAGSKVFYRQSGSDAQYNGCFEQVIPCTIDDPKTLIKDTSLCNPNTFKWAPNSTPTGFTVGGKKPYYAFKDICVRNDGYKLKYYEANGTNHQYDDKGYRCRTTSQGVSEWNCNTISKVPTPIVTIDDSSGRVTYNNSTGKTLIVKVEDLCPKDKVLWRSYLYDNNGDAKDATTFNWTNDNTTTTTDIRNAHSSASWDLCMKLTGYGQVNKNPTTGKSQVRCLATIVSDSVCVREYPNQ
jgi:hypothetical protein